MKATFPTLPSAITLLAAGLIPLSAASEAQAKSATWRGQSLTEFDSSENEKFAWQIVNDGVMGGLSEGNLEFTEAGTMKFYGDLSLKNNGGFSTARSGDVDFNLSNDLGLLLLVKGDGRTYEARLDSSALFRGNPVSFSGKFTTSKGNWQQVKIPFSDFKGSFRGTELPDAELDPSVIKRLWILLADKQEGPFNLEIDWVRTYGKGQGQFVERKKATAKPGKVASKRAGSLIETAVADGRFTTLKAALDAAGLTTFFQWDNKLTVFAPTDEAFAKLPKKVLENLLKPENKKELIAVLSYHVSAGAKGIADSLNAAKVETVEGTPLEVAFSEGRVRVNDAVVIDGDLECSDGIIHVIDSVLLPPAPEKPRKKTVLSVAEQAGSFSTLLAAIGAAELGAALEGEGPFTVFAPTEEAFAALPEGTVESLLKKENREDLAALLKYHVVPGRISAGDALNAGEASSLQGDKLKFGVTNGRLTVNESTIRTADLDGGNGVIHVIDAVLLPPAAAGKKTAADNKKAEKTSLDPAEAIIAAIDKGVPLYNGGEAGRCAAVYEECLEELANHCGFDAKVRHMLETAVERGKSHDSATDRAWVYRRALDGMMEYLSHGKG